MGVNDRFIGVDVRSNIKGVIADFQALTERITDKAAVRALNRAMEQSATEASRRIRERYNVRHQAVLRAMKKKRASRRSLQSKIEMRGARLGLIEFDARQVAAGVSVKVLNQGARKTLRHAFIATNTATGYRGVWVRKGKTRYPIQNLRSISVPAAFRNKVVLDAVREVARVSFLKNYRQQIRFLSGAD